MDNIGEVTAQRFEGARKALSVLSETELREYRVFIAEIAGDEKYSFVDETMSGLTAKGKLEVIDQVLKAYKK